MIATNFYVIVERLKRFDCLDKLMIKKLIIVDLKEI